jgi:hypothetical protein
MLTGALALIVWGSLGLYDGLHTGFSGGLYDPEYRVPEIGQDGLAARSGFRAGDRVISVEGRPVEQLGMESRWPRSLVPRIGESRRFVVERDGERAAIDVVYPGPFKAAVHNRIRAALIGLGFLGCGLWAFLTVPTRPARSVAWIGLAAGASAALGLGPHLGRWSGVQGHVSTAADVLTFALLLRFFVTFPGPKAVSRSRVAAGLVYGAWIGLLVFLSVEVIVHPALYYTTGGVTSPLILAYVLLMFAAVIHTVVTSRRTELRDSGMAWVLAGLLLVIARTAVAFAFPLNLPAWSDAAWVLALPLSMVLAVRTHARLELTRPQAPCGRGIVGASQLRPRHPSEYPRRRRGSFERH